MSQRSSNRKWVHSVETNEEKSIKEIELINYLFNGWELGRKPKEVPVYMNHKVVSVEFLNVIEDAYDLQIEGNYDKNGGPEHCFALEAGVFVHNTYVDKLEGQVCTALAIPQPLLGGQAGEGAQGLSPNSSLENMDVRFSRNITRIQRSLLQGITRLCQIHLSYLNMDPDTKMFELHMNTTSSAGENEAKENLKLGIEVTSSLFDALAKVVGEDKLDRRAVFEVANENYLKLPDITYDDLLLPEGKSNVPVAPQEGAGPSAGGEMVASEGAPEAGAEVPPLNASNKPKRGKPLYETIDSRPREGDLKAFTLADKALWESLYGNVTGTILKETK